MKREWRKHEKELYLPPKKPSRIQVPELKYFTIEGKGNPNDKFFVDYIQVLYSLSYGVKMSPKSGLAPKGYFEYTAYPLEGVWDITEKAKKKGIKEFDKSELVFKLMIRQPDFADETFALKILESVKEPKPQPMLDEVVFETIAEGGCVQMIHIGHYDDKPVSFKIMEEFAQKQGFIRSSKKHREIYLSDYRKVPPDKLRTVLRFKVFKS